MYPFNPVAKPVDKLLYLLGFPSTTGDGSHPSTVGRSVTFLIHQGVVTGTTEVEEHYAMPLNPIWPGHPGGVEKIWW